MNMNTTFIRIKRKTHVLLVIKRTLWEYKARWTDAILYASSF